MAERRISGERLAVFGFAVLTVLLIQAILFPPKPSMRVAATPSFEFLGYTNNRGQTEALFRLNHAPRPVLSDGLWELRYQSPTGWARPSAPTVGFDLFGWDGTGSIAAITVETTNVPARVVMDIWTRRHGFYGLYDRFLDLWEKLTGKPHELRGNVTYVTNQTRVISKDQ